MQLTHTPWLLPVQLSRYWPFGHVEHTSQLDPLVNKLNWHEVEVAVGVDEDPTAMALVVGMLEEDIRDYW